MMENSEVKQVYSSLYINENEIQVLCSEFYNTRFNIIFQEDFECKGIIDFKIVDEHALISSIKHALGEASKNIGASIKKVLLIIPPVLFKSIPIKVNVRTKNNYVENSDVASALTNSLKSNIDKDLAIINASINKYNINGISTRKMPIGERAKDFSVDIDLLCASKDIVYSYIKSIISSGYDVLDISLSIYSIIKESLLYEKSLSSNIILLDISKSYTNLSLIHNSKIYSSEIIHVGLNNFVDEVYKSFQFGKNNILDLIKYNTYNDNNKNDVIFAWNDNNGTNCNITNEKLFNAFNNTFELYVDNLYSMCKPILDKGNVSVFITGEGADMNMLVNKIGFLFNCDVKTYIPDTIGVRNPALTALFGAMYVYREKAILNNLNVSCIDLLEYNNAVEIDSNRQNDIGESITTSIKKFFNDYLHKEGK